METKAKVVLGFGPYYVAAQLITRDSEEVNYESGLAILPEMDQAIVRHMADKIDYIYTAFPVNMSIDYDEWYVMSLMVRNGIVKAYVNEVQIYMSKETFPVGEYREPHSAVRYGVAQFEYIRVYVISGWNKGSGKAPGCRGDEKDFDRLGSPDKQSCQVEG